jgi:hypothetical protein
MLPQALLKYFARATARAATGARRARELSAAMGPN